LHRAAGHDWLGVASDNHFATKLPLELDARRMSDEPAGRHAYDHDRPVAMARFFVRQDGSQSLMTVSDKRIWFWEDGKQRQVRRHDDVINSAEPSPDGEFAVSGSDDGTARVWSTRGRAAVAELRGHHDAVTSAQFGRNETEVITGSRDGTVVVWSVRPQKLIWSKVNRWALSAAVGPGGQVAVVCGEPLGSLVDSHACDLVPLQGRAASGLSMVDVLRDGTNTVNQVSWHKDGHLLLGRYALGGEPRGRVAVWTDVGRDVTPRWLNDWVSATFVENTDEILTVGTDRLGLWPGTALDADREPPRLLDLAVKGVYLAAISPDGQWIAAASEPDNEVTLTRRSAEARPVPLGRHGGQIKSVQFSRDGKWFVTTSNDRTARVWSTEAPEDVVRLEGGHRAGLSFGSFSPDGRRVVTSSADNTVRAWDARSGQELVSLEWHREGVNEVHFLADGRSLLTASDDGSVKVAECTACMEELGEIVKRIEKLAVMPDTEAKALQGELDELTPWFLRWFEPLLTR
jgi:WD40 repeat protein